MDSTKYVIVETEFGCESPILISPILSHADVVKPGFKVISAGFVSIGFLNGEMTVSVWGESKSLREDFPDNYKSRPEDARFIKKALRDD